MARLILVTGFQPFGGERSNPSWEVAARLDGREFNGAAVRAMRLPVDCRRASQAVIGAIERFAPVGMIGLGQAGGRPILSLEKVAINVADNRAGHEHEGGLAGRPVIAGGPDAYFSRLPLAALVRTLKHHNIPAGLSLSAGVYVCNTVMYSALHALRRRQRVLVGFIHLPYDATQAARHRAVASMSLEMMIAGIELALKVVAREL
jgi:pyroglutamyl-peptidase